MPLRPCAFLISLYIYLTWYIIDINVFSFFFHRHRYCTLVMMLSSFGHLFFFPLPSRLISALLTQSNSFFIYIFSIAYAMYGQDATVIHLRFLDGSKEGEGFLLYVYIHWYILYLYDVIMLLVYGFRNGVSIYLIWFDFYYAIELGLELELELELELADLWPVALGRLN